MSTQFQDGPAKSVSLELQRTPFFLRVVQDQTPNCRKWDALDLIDDKPDPKESIFVYRLADRPVRGFIDGRNYRGPFVGAWYCFHEPQPIEAEVRENEDWRAWCEKNAGPFREMKGQP